MGCYEDKNIFLWKIDFKKKNEHVSMVENRLFRWNIELICEKCTFLNKLTLFIPSF